MTTATIGGTYTVHRILMGTKNRLQFTAGNAATTVHHWDTYESNNACLTGVFGLTLNSSIISLGFYFNEEVKPDGQRYLPSGINIEKPFNPPDNVKVNVNLTEATNTTTNNTSNNVT